MGNKYNNENSGCSINFQDVGGCLEVSESVGMFLVLLCDWSRAQ